jgi:hypothetical protein
MSSESLRKSIANLQRSRVLLRAAMAWPGCKLSAEAKLAASIAMAIDADVRGRVVDSFCDYFRALDDDFDVTAFCDMVRHGPRLP